MFNNVTLFPLSESEDNVKSQYQWMTLFHIVLPGNMAPPIITNPYPSYIIKNYSALYGEDSINNIWEPFTLEQLEVAAVKFYADLSTPGEFNMTSTLMSLGQKLCENRRITRCELILAMKCHYLGMHRLHAISTNFHWTSMFTNNVYHCAMNTSQCICSHIRFE
jgi:hypothetical protein